jgi:site-specific DNA-methyltransferase (adenine-specific)
LKNKTLKIERMMIVEQMLKNAQKPLLHIADVSGSALFQGDCLDIMPLIPDKSVQLILADLPYGTTSIDWDNIIPMDKLWEQYKRIMTDNCAIVLFGSEPFSSLVRTSNLKMYKYDWKWEKAKATLHALCKKRPMKSDEDIMVFYNQQPIYNPQMTIGEKYKGRNNTKNHKELKGEWLIGQGSRTDNEGTRYPRTNIYFANENKAGQHPTQKPLELMKYLISTYSNENDMVLDNTMGSGTCPLASAILNRRFIGIEKDEDYFKIAVNRLKEFGYLR